jgi:AcrR family transcriptional regulator
MARKLDMSRRAELAARAVDAIRARGVHRITMSDLAVDLGLKRPTLYFYFRDLGAVFDAALDDTHRRWAAHVMTAVTGIDHPIDLLAEVVRATVGFHQGQRDRIVLLFQLWAVGGRDPEVILARGRQLAEPLRAYLVDRIGDGVRRGLVGPCEPAAIVDLVLTVLDGALVQEVTRAAPVATIVRELENRVLGPLRLGGDRKPDKPDKPDKLDKSDKIAKTDREGALDVHPDKAPVDRAPRRKPGGDGAPARRAPARRRRRG